MKITLIVAFDRNNAIGRDNELPWKLPDDLKRFKALTLGKPILMGRKTAQSLGRALPGRLNLVLTRSAQVPFEGMQAVASVDEAIAQADASGAQELCVIGGGEVYRLTMELADVLAVTEVARDRGAGRHPLSADRPGRVGTGTARATHGRCPPCVRVRLCGLSPALRHARC